MTVLLAVLVAAVATYAFRATGPLLHGRVRLPGVADALLGDASVVLLSALAVTSAVFQGQAFAGWARPAGVLVAGVLAVLKVPFPVVVVAAALTTALLRAAGVD